LHPPFGVGLAVVDEAGGSVGLERAVEGAVIEDIGGRDRAVRVQTVAFDAVEGLVLDEGGICAMTYQSPMKRLRSTVRSMARKGGFASAPHESFQDWQPTKPAQRRRIQNRVGMTKEYAPGAGKLDG
jgi:hypothetical protein